GVDQVVIGGRGNYGGRGDGITAGDVDRLDRCASADGGIDKGDERRVAERGNRNVGDVTAGSGRARLNQPAHGRAAGRIHMPNNDVLVGSAGIGRAQIGDDVGAVGVGPHHRQLVKGGVVDHRKDVAEGL